MNFLDGHHIAFFSQYFRAGGAEVRIVVNHITCPLHRPLKTRDFICVDWDPSTNSCPGARTDKTVLLFLPPPPELTKKGFLHRKNPPSAICYD